MNIRSDKHPVEKNTRKSEETKKVESSRFFSVTRPDGSNVSNSSNPGITIQIRLKNPAPTSAARLLTRKNTEFWLSATD